MRKIESDLKIATDVAIDNFLCELDEQTSVEVEDVLRDAGLNDVEVQEIISSQYSDETAYKFLAFASSLYDEYSNTAELQTILCETVERPLSEIELEKIFSYREAVVT